MFTVRNAFSGIGSNDCFCEHDKKYSSSSIVTGCGLDDQDPFSESMRVLLSFTTPRPALVSTHPEI
jgi:hypothetical protein